MIDPLAVLVLICWVGALIALPIMAIRAHRRHAHKPRWSEVERAAVLTHVRNASWGAPRFPLTVGRNGNWDGPRFRR